MSSSRRTKIIAHRGASFEAPENTLIAFERAIELGVDVIEMDIHLTKDGVPIIYHDSVFGRTAVESFLKRSTELFVHEIQKLDVGSWFLPKFAGEKIPTLQGALDLIGKKVPLMLEVKKHRLPAKKIIEPIFNVLKDFREKHWIGSFDPLIIKEVIMNYPDYPVLGIVEDYPYIDEFKNIGVKHLALSFELLSQELIEELHQSDFRIWTFTVDNPRLAKHLCEIPIEGIITNNPAALVSLS